MGYDVYVADGPDETERAAVKAAEARRADLAARLRVATSPDEVASLRDDMDQAYDDIQTARRSYFRLNIWGMGTAREYMGAFGMLTTENMPQWPHPEAYGLEESPDDPEWFEEGPDRVKAENALTVAGRRFLNDQKAVMEADHGGSGIPHYKFTTNDGWLVTSREIEAALMQYENADSEHKAAAIQEGPWWPSWIAFLTYAQQRGGIRVH